MSTRRRRAGLPGLAGLAAALVLAAPAAADTIRLKPAMTAAYTIGTGIEGDEADLSRLELRPELSVRGPGNWRAELALQIEGAAGDTGLGALDTYSDVSRPLSLGPDARLAIDTATLAWRKRSTRITLGKQSLAWGVLDGLQVTDRFDAVRRREAVFTEHRPQRLSRWGARAEFTRAGVKWDAGLLLDGTADQFAEPGDTFAVTAPRLRAGLPASAPLPQLDVRTPGTPTAGLRASRRFDGHDASLLVIHGPDTEPVFRPTDTGVALEYDTRTLVGATWQTGSGSRVWRLETAWIGDQPVNLEGPGLRTDTRSRWLAGVGMDWDLRGGAFLNAQLGADHVEGGALVRPDTDVIATVRLQKPFANETWKASAELLGSLSDGDGTFRPAVTWQVSDRFRLQGGADIVWGDRAGLFGQFRDADRVWMKLSWMV